MVYHPIKMGMRAVSSAVNGMVRETVLPAGVDVTKPLIPPLRTPTAADNDEAYGKLAYDLYSDTVTLPTEEMRKAMAEAVCADEVHQVHPPTVLFQEQIAQLTGKEAALFMPSGTLSNQLALHLHILQACGPASVLCDQRAHVYQYETGGMAYHSRAATQTVAPQNGHHLTLEDVQEHAIVEENQHYALTRVISLENTLSGLVFPQDEIVRISAWAREHGLAMHLDGARLWNAAAETGLPLSELCAPFDTVSLWLSKGLGAPIGSILVGPRAMIDRARKFRKLFGAGMRQLGVLTAAAHVAVHDTFPQLRRTHDLARRCARMLAARGVPLTVPCETNMVWFDAAVAGYDPDEISRRAEALDPPMTIRCPRMVFHYQIRDDAVERLKGILDAMDAAKKTE